VWLGASSNIHSQRRMPIILIYLSRIAYKLPQALEC
jgi:hypothetical protein